QLVALLDDPPRLVELGQVERGVDALAEEIHGEGDQVDVARPLPVSEEPALHPLGAGHQAELRRRDGGAAVVVRVDREDRRVAPGEDAGDAIYLVSDAVWGDIT